MHVEVCVCVCVCVFVNKVLISVRVTYRETEYTPAKNKIYCEKYLSKVKSWRKNTYNLIPPIDGMVL